MSWPRSTCRRCLQGEIGKHRTLALPRKPRSTTTLTLSPGAGRRSRSTIRSNESRSNGGAPGRTSTQHPLSASRYALLRGETPRIGRIPCETRWTDPQRRERMKFLGLMVACALAIVLVSGPGSTVASAQGVTTPVRGESYRIQNRWIKNQYIHSQNGPLEIGTMQPRLGECPMENHPRAQWLGEDPERAHPRSLHPQSKRQDRGWAQSSQIGPARCGSSNPSVPSG